MTVGESSQLVRARVELARGRLESEGLSPEAGIGRVLDFVEAHHNKKKKDRPVFVARAALNRTLTDVETSPVIQLAQQVVGNSHHILRSLWRVARRKEEDDMLSDQASLIGRRWSEYSDYWDKLSDRYRLIYETEHSLWQRAQQEAVATAEEE